MSSKVMSKIAGLVYPGADEVHPPTAKYPLVGKPDLATRCVNCGKGGSSSSTCHTFIEIRTESWVLSATPSSR